MKKASALQKGRGLFHYLNQPEFDVRKLSFLIEDQTDILFGLCHSR